MLLILLLFMYTADCCTVVDSPVNDNTSTIWALFGAGLVWKRKVAENKLFVLFSDYVTKIVSNYI